MGGQAIVEDGLVPDETFAVLGDIEADDPIRPRDLGHDLRGREQGGGGTAGDRGPAYGRSEQGRAEGWRGQGSAGHETGEGAAGTGQHERGPFY